MTKTISETRLTLFTSNKGVILQGKAMSNKEAREHLQLKPNQNELLEVIETENEFLIKYIKG